MRIPSFFMILALASAGAANAAEWTEIVAGKERQVEIDRASILQSDPGTKVAWGRIVMKDAEVASAGYKSVKALNRYDCRNGSFSTIKRVYLNADQRVIRQERVVEPKVIKVAPGTVDERLFREVCKPATAAKLAEVAKKAEAVARKAASSDTPTRSIAPRVVVPLTEEQKRAAVAARNAALAHMEAKKRANAPAPVVVPRPAVISKAVPQPKARLVKATPPARKKARRARPARKKAKPAPVVVKKAARWSYSGAGAPEHWSGLKPEFAVCGNGQRQSPIDIRDGIRVDLEPIRFDYRASFFRIIDNGHTVQVNVGEGSSIRVMGRHYDLVQFHFHRPSEFRINGRGYDMEAHLVHRDLDGRLAVVSVMLERGTAHPLVQTLWNNLPLERHVSYAPEVAIDLNDLLPEDRRYATFMGSLTTPPCTEGVLWMVMKKPVELSVDQISIFSRLHPHNARPVQQLAGRLIKDSR